MKKKCKVESILELFFIVIVILTIIILFTTTIYNNSIKEKDDFIYLKNMTIENEYREDCLLLKNDKDYIDYFNEEAPSNVNFTNNNYILISIPVAACAEHNIKPDYYKIDGNTVEIQFKYTKECNSSVEMAKTIFYLLKVPKSLDNIDIKVSYKNRNNIRRPYDTRVDKPIIYLYPENETNVVIKLNHPELITTSYPKYENEWNVLAKPDGTLIDNKTGKSLYALYWEGKNNNLKVEKDGFVVSGKDTISFLEEKLEILGLNERESEEFIIYWLPKMEKNKYNYIRFQTIEEINNYMSLEVNPKPDTIIRILMTYKKLDKKIDVKGQKLTPSVREGFTVVEWGGSEIK